MLENPERLRQIVKQSGAHSSDLIHPESADELCDRCVDFASAWKPEADRIWTTTKHRKIFTQYYRDTPEGKREAASCCGDCSACAQAVKEAVEGGQQSTEKTDNSPEKGDNETK